MLSMVRPPTSPSVVHTAAADRGKLVTLIAASFVVRRRRRQSVYDKKRQCYAKDKKNRINLYSSGKSEAAITNNKGLQLRYCTDEAN